MTKEERNAMCLALCKQPHHIKSEKIKFYFHPERSGHNTLHQICNNLEAFVDELIAKKLTEQQEVQL